MKWLPSPDHEILVTEKKSIVGRVWEDPDGLPDACGWWGGTYNSAGRLTPLLPKPCASNAIAKQMVEEAVKNQREVKG